MPRRSCARGRSVPSHARRRAIRSAGASRRGPTTPARRGAPRYHGGALGLRHRGPALHRACRGAARRVPGRCPAPPRGALDGGRRGAVPRRRVSATGVPGGRHRRYRRAGRRRFGDRRRRGALPVRRADGPRRRPLDASAAECLAYELEIPGTDGYYLGETGWWYEESGEGNPPVQIAASGVDTLDATGRLPLRLKLGETVRGRPSRATLEATVVDVNRQTVSASASLDGASGGLLPRRQARGRRATSGRPARRCGSASSPCAPTASGCRASG